MGKKNPPKFPLLRSSGGISAQIVFFSKTFFYTCLNFGPPARILTFLEFDAWNFGNEFLDSEVTEKPVNAFLHAHYAENLNVRFFRYMTM